MGARFLKAAMQGHQPTLWALVNPEAEIVHIPYAEAYAEGFEDIRYRVPDVSKLRQAVGLAPRHDLDRILTDVRDYLSAS